MLQARLCLLLTAFVWGSTFVAQRLASDLVGPHTYNATRFLLGVLTVSPLLIFMKQSAPPQKAKVSIIWISLLLGFLLFLGASLQQYAIAYTTASKAAFLTALYIVIVPTIGLFIGQQISLLALAGVLCSVIGAALLSLKESFIPSYGDGIILISTLFWALHIVVLSKVTKQYNPFKLAIGQFFGCALFSGIAALLSEPFSWTIIENSWLFIAWGGILSAGLGFTGQLLGQRQLPATQASLIMSLEIVFAGVMGYFILGERLNYQEIWGLIAMCTGVLLAQLPCPHSLHIGPLCRRKE